MKSTTTARPKTTGEKKEHNGGDATERTDGELETETATTTTTTAITWTTTTIARTL